MVDIYLSNPRQEEKGFVSHVQKRLAPKNTLGKAKRVRASLFFSSTPLSSSAKHPYYSPRTYYHPSLTPPYLTPSYAFPSRLWPHIHYGPHLRISRSSPSTKQNKQRTLPTVPRAPSSLTGMLNKPLSCTCTLPELRPIQCSSITALSHKSITAVCEGGLCAALSSFWGRV